MKRTAVMIISFFLLAACAAFCQQRPDDSNTSAVQRQELGTWNSLPDAPSPVEPPSPPDTFHAFFKPASSSLTSGAVAFSTGIRRDITSGLPTRLAGLYLPMPAQKESGTSAFFGKYLYPLLLKQDLRHYASTSGGIMGRISYAASHALITRDDSGKKKPNTSYFVRTLTSAIIHAASRPSALYVGPQPPSLAVKSESRQK